MKQKNIQATLSETPDFGQYAFSENDPIAAIFLADICAKESPRVQSFYLRDARLDLINELKEWKDQANSLLFENARLKKIVFNQGSKNLEALKKKISTLQADLRILEENNHRIAMRSHENLPSRLIYSRVKCEECKQDLKRPFWCDACYPKAKQIDA